MVLDILASISQKTLPSSPATSPTSAPTSQPATTTASNLPIPGNDPANLIVPGNLSDPELLEVSLIEARSYGIPTDEFEKHASAPDDMRVFFGGNVGATPINQQYQSQAIVSLAGRHFLSIRRGPHGILLSGKVLGQDGRVIVQIDRNKFFVNDAVAFRVERPNPQTLIVFNQAGNEAININMPNPHSVSIIAGEFWEPGGTSVRIVGGWVIWPSGRKMTGHFVRNYRADPSVVLFADPPDGRCFDFTPWPDAAT